MAATRRRVIALAGAAAVTAAAGAALFAGTSHGTHNPPSRPHPIAHNEGFGNEKVTVFFYPQNFFCTDEWNDDLDGPNHNGDGVVAAQDPDEFQEPSVGPPGSPCIVGRTARGSLPSIDPTGRPIANAEPVWAILPFFDRNANGVLDVVDPTVTGPNSPTPVQCPEPGPPYTKHLGPFGTCAMHPSTLHVEPVLGSLLAGVSVPGGHIALPNHSHIVRNSAVSINPVWWQVISVRVDDPSIWPDFDGRCPANPRGGEPCLTSVDALREAQRRRQAGPDTATNVWLFFDSKEGQPQPAD